MIAHLGLDYSMHRFSYLCMEVCVKNYFHCVSKQAVANLSVANHFSRIF